MANNEMDPLVQNILFGGERPAPCPVGGDTDRTIDPVADMIFRERYGFERPGPPISNSKVATSEFEGLVSAVVSKLFGNTVPAKSNPAVVDPMKQVDPAIARILDPPHTRQ
jgi:hypothetical protein